MKDNEFQSKIHQKHIQCIELRKRGHTYRSIARICKLSFRDIAYCIKHPSEILKKN